MEYFLGILGNEYLFFIRPYTVHLMIGISYKKAQQLNKFVIMLDFNTGMKSKFSIFLKFSNTWVAKTSNKAMILSYDIHIY